MLPDDSLLFPAHIESELDHVTCSGQRNISKHEAGRGLTTACAWGLAFLEYCSEMAMLFG